MVSLYLGIGVAVGVGPSVGVGLGLGVGGRLAVFRSMTTMTPAAQELPLMKASMFSVLNWKAILSAIGMVFLLSGKMHKPPNPSGYPASSSNLSPRGGE